MTVPSTAAFPDASADHDVAVIGGGVNGCGIARDLAGRGWRVLLVEQDDLASHTSSASTKLIHGGLRYLEHGEFTLVRKALHEREVLLRSAPHLMRPLRFVMPHDPALRPAGWIRLGLFLYDHLAHRDWLPDSEHLDLRTHPAGVPLRARYHEGFAYSDAWVDDARLVVLCALDAAERGAVVMTRTRCVGAQPAASGGWLLRLQVPGGDVTEVRARALVNATGPWVEQWLRVGLPGAPAPQRHLRRVKGSHIVVPKHFEHGQGYLLQNPDRRITFALPYEQNYTLIGTTDREHTGDPSVVRIDQEEIDYLCEQVNRYFQHPIRPDDVVWSWSGVRPLLDDAQGAPAAVTRDYVLDDGPPEWPPLLSVWGGKITTFRKLSQDAADRIGERLGSVRAAWTESAALPGGDLLPWVGALQRPDVDFDRFARALAHRHAGRPEAWVRRIARAYGSRVVQWLESPTGKVADLGAEVAPGLFEAELEYLRRVEWARTPDDVLWRRSKLGLHFTPGQRQAVADRWSRCG